MSQAADEAPQRLGPVLHAVQMALGLPEKAQMGRDMKALREENEGLWKENEGLRKGAR